MFSIELNKVVTARDDGKREYYLTISKMLKDTYGRYKYPVETQDVCIVSSLGYNTVNGFLRDYLATKKTIDSSKMFLGAKFAFKDWSDTYENQIDELNKTRNEFFLIDGKRGVERQSDNTTSDR